MKLFKLLKKVNYRHYISISIILFFIVFSLFQFPYALARLGESIKGFWDCCKYYYFELFTENNNITPIINDLSKVSFDMAFNIPSEWESFKVYMERFFELFSKEENFIDFLGSFSTFIYNLSYFILLVIPTSLILTLYFWFFLKKKNNDYDVDSKPLRYWKNFSNKVLQPIKKWFLSYYDFLNKHKLYYILSIIIWGFAFNLISIVISFLGYYLYFFSSFDTLSIFTQIYKLLFDISPMLDFIPLIVWLILGYFLFDRFRKKIAKLRLRHWEMKNRGFINSLPIVVMGCGTMGSKKTTMITDMGLSQEVMFRDKAYEKILETDLMFPNFPWINLENVIKIAVKNRYIYNLATARCFIDRLYHYYSLGGSKAQKKAIRRHLKKSYGFDMGSNLLFDYDYKRYGLTFDDKLKLINIWEAIKTYTQLYFFYIIKSSLLIANYSIRTDNLIRDVGNFPIWDTDFFRRDSRLIDSFSRHSHILDFDVLRLGKKVIENNPLADMFEFGIVLITEVGKERGNTLELSDKKKNSLETNQKNDLFDSELKMIRHSATIDNYPFVKIFTDEQRPESWGANARDLCNILHMEQSNDLSLAMPFFDLEELIYAWAYTKFEDFYSMYRYNRGDNTLLMYFIKSIFSRFHNYYKGLYNLYGYMDMSILIENGTQDGLVREHKYKLMVKKIYSKRFSTDCHSGFFHRKALRSNYGLDDVPEYRTEKATLEELKLQNSYFIADLNSGLAEYEEI